MIAMNRRHLIGTMLGAAVSAQSLAIATLQRLPLTFGVATYSLRSFQRDPAIRMIHEMGIGYADVKEFHLPQNDSPASARRRMPRFRKSWNQDHRRRQHHAGGAR